MKNSEKGGTYRVNHSTPQNEVGRRDSGKQNNNIVVQKLSCFLQKRTQLVYCSLDIPARNKYLHLLKLWIVHTVLVSHFSIVAPLMISFLIMHMP